MAQTAPADLAPPFLLGVAAGVRSATPWGVLASRGRLGHGRGRTAALLATGGEYVGDKLPATPDRTAAGPLGGRIASGALAGTFVGGLAGTAAGAVGGLLGTYASYYLRSALTEVLPLPPVVVALLEDGLAIGLAAAATTGAE